MGAILTAGVVYGNQVIHLWWIVRTRMFFAKVLKLVDIVQMDALLLGEFSQQLRLGGSCRLVKGLKGVDADDNFKIWTFGLQTYEHW